MIPAVAHFVWFGTALPWVHLLAMRSAVRAGGFERAVLHHADDLSGAEWYPALVAEPGVELRPLDAEAALRRTPHPDVLVEIYRRLEAPAARSNMVRAAILWAEGGVYLDLDTVTVAPLDDLRRDGAFCGAERVALPRTVTGSRDPRRWAGALVRLGARDVLRRVPGGWRAFRRIEGLYPAAANNAVLAAEAGHPFVGRLLKGMTEVTPDRQTVRFALGTHLLQEVVSEARPGEVTVHPPEVFFPLGPEISEHWFRTVERPRLEQVLARETRVVHWYASVRTRALAPQVDPTTIRARQAQELFSCMAARFIDGA